MELKGKRIRTRTNLRENFSIRDVWEQVWKYHKGYENFLEKELTPLYPVDRCILRGFTESGWQRPCPRAGDWLRSDRVDAKRLEAALLELCADTHPDFVSRSAGKIRALAESVSPPAAEEKSSTFLLFLLLHIQAGADITEDGHAFCLELLAEIGERHMRMQGCRYEQRGRLLVADGSKWRIVLPLGLCGEGPFQEVTLTNPGFFPVQVRLGESPAVRTLFRGESVELLYRAGTFAGFLPRIPAAAEKRKARGDLCGGADLWECRLGEHCIQLSADGVVTEDGRAQCWGETVTAVGICRRGCLTAAGRGIYLWAFETGSLRLLAETDLPTEELWAEEDTLWYRTQGSSRVYSLAIPEEGGNEDAFDG